MFEFNEFLIQGGLVDAGFDGNPFTWSNNRAEHSRVWKRLERMLLNGHALTAFPTLSVKNIAGICSDHCPLLVSTTTPLRNLGFFNYHRRGNPTLSSWILLRSVWRANSIRMGLLTSGSSLSAFRESSRS
ncbi:hypothetical protein QQ045_001202 [Rhodiola kirilowii]